MLRRRIAWIFWPWLTAKFRLCKGCRAWWGVRWESSRTAYHWDGKGKNPNADVPLCRICAKEHHEYWTDMWRGYYAGCL